MTFSDIPEGSAVYVDANVFICRFRNVSQDCDALLERCREERLYGFISTLTLWEVCHRTMWVEARTHTGRTTVDAQYLRKHPEIVRALKDYAAYLQEIASHANLGVIEVAENDILQSQHIRDSYGLLTSDSITAHIALDYGIPAIATTDPDFDRIEGIQVFKPRDI